MIKSFMQFINENHDEGEFINRFALDLLSKIREYRTYEADYASFSGMSFKEPFEFRFKLFLRKDPDPTLKEDSHFHSLPWEKVNFLKNGYAIDANTGVEEIQGSVPVIKMHLIVDPKKEPHLYSKLHARLIDILTHETNHLDQLGLSREPFNANPSSMEDRNSAKKSFKYFLLPDEIESMVEGMYASAKHQNLPLDTVFDQYLQPFLQTNYITEPEYDKVMFSWVKFALEHYPGATFSKKVEKIIDSI